MAKFEDGCYGSLKGIALIGKVLAGKCCMHYTRVAVGKGAIPDDMTPKTLTEPPGYVMDAQIASVTNPVDGECQVSIQVNSKFVENGFYATWFILYAEDPDEGEVPFTAMSIENEPEWIRPSSSIVGKLAHFDIIAAVGDVDAVTAIIDPEAIATVGHVCQLFSDHGSDPNAHANAFPGLLDAALQEFSKDGKVPESFCNAIVTALETMTGEGQEPSEALTNAVAAILQEIARNGPTPGGMASLGENGLIPESQLPFTRKVIATQERDPTRPNYGLDLGGEAGVALDMGPYTGTVPYSAVVSGTEYDALNISVNGDTAPDGTIILSKTEE